ncbi:MAG: putative solute-binding protein [Myxococcota bacterium]
MSIRNLVAFCLLAVASRAALPAQAAESRTLCVYDPAGRSGDFFAVMNRYATAASAWGYDLDLKPYTDEETAAKDYEAGQCDGVTATGVRLQRFNRFPSTIEAIGGLTSYPMLKQMIGALTTSDAAAAKLTANGNTTVGFIPVGAVYLFVRDRNVDTVGELAGKRIATLAYDKPSLFMVERVGAIVVPADLGSLGPKFNNGDVDACYVSAPAYRPFELQRGLGTSGGIIRSPLAQATLQVMLRTDAFSGDFLKTSRRDLAGRFDEALKVVKKAESEIPAKYWVDVPAERQEGWSELFQGVRIALRDEKKAYAGSMLTVMRKLRCAADGARSECAEKKE